MTTPTAQEGATSCSGRGAGRCRFTPAFDVSGEPACVYHLTAAVQRVLRRTGEALVRRFTQTEENYTGPDPAVRCSYPPCRNRLRRASQGGPQWCSPQHRSLTETPG